LQLFAAGDVDNCPLYPCRQPLAGFFADLCDGHQHDLLALGSLEYRLRQQVPRVLLDTRRYTNRLRGRESRGAHIMSVSADLP